MMSKRPQAQATIQMPGGPQLPTSALEKLRADGRRQQNNKTATEELDRSFKLFVSYIRMFARGRDLQGGDRPATQVGARLWGAMGPDRRCFWTQLAAHLTKTGADPTAWTSSLNFVRYVHTEMRRWIQARRQMPGYVEDNDGYDWERTNNFCEIEVAASGAQLPYDKDIVSMLKMVSERLSAPPMSMSGGTRPQTQVAGASSIPATTTQPPGLRTLHAPRSKAAPPTVLNQPEPRYHTASSFMAASIPASREASLAGAPAAAFSGTQQASSMPNSYPPSSGSQQPLSTPASYLVNSGQNFLSQAGPSTSGSSVSWQNAVSGTNFASVQSGDYQPYISGPSMSWPNATSGSVSASGMGGSGLYSAPAAPIQTTVPGNFTASNFLESYQQQATGSSTFWQNMASGVNSVPNSLGSYQMHAPGPSSSWNTVTAGGPSTSGQLGGHQLYPSAPSTSWQNDGSSSNPMGLSYNYQPHAASGSSTLSGPQPSQMNFASGYAGPPMFNAETLAMLQSMAYSQTAHAGAGGPPQADNKFVFGADQGYVFNAPSGMGPQNLNFGSF